MDTNGAASKATNWAAPEFMEPILTQILSAGKEAFMTVKANVKANPTTGVVARQYNQREVVAVS